MASLSIYALYNHSPWIFDDMACPDELNKQKIIDQILLECFELELLYPDPYFMKKCIDTWSFSESEVWIKLYETTVLEYNPIWNKDGIISIERKAEYNDDGTNIGSVKGFNSDAWAEHTRGTTNATGDTSGMEIRKEQGNIGVTTTQQMIKEERDISEFNIYAYIADSFRKRFCLLVY